MAVKLLVTQANFCFDKDGKYLGAEGDETPIWWCREEPK
jgi:hypothetical protein